MVYLILRNFALVIFILSLSGCMGIKGMSNADVALIDSVSVNESVIMPEEVYYNGPEQAIGFALGGAIGSSIAEGAKTKSDKIKLFLEGNGVFVDRIVSSELVKQIKNKVKYKDIYVQSGGNYTFNIEILRYGLGTYNVAGDKYEPSLEMYISLVDKNNKLVWKQWSRVTSYDEVAPEKSFGEYVSDPKLIEEAFRLAAIKVVEDILTELN